MPFGEDMKNIRSFVTIIALANFAVAVWHLYLVEKLHPAAPIAESVYIAAFAGVLTFAGVALVWMRRQKIGSLVLIVVFTVGLVVGSSEHFFVTGPNNVFDVGNGDWALLFKISVAILVLLEVAGLSVSGRMLAARS
jgi:hypothetical protein